MEWNQVISCQGRDIPVCLTARQLGNDWVITLAGGDISHIGTAVIAVPRPSLKNSSIISSTSSVINLPGHKDEILCRKIAEQFCLKSGHTVLCTGGIHINGATETCIQSVSNCVMLLVEQALKDIFHF